MIEEIKSILKTHPLRCALLFVCIQLQALLLLAFPFVNIFVYDDLMVTGDLVLYVKLVALVILILLAFAATSILLDYQMSELKFEYLSKFRESLLFQLMKKRYTYFITANPGDLVQKIIPDVDILGESTIKVIYGCFFALQSFVLLAGMLYIEKFFFYVFLSIYLSYGVWIYLWGRQIKKSNMQIGKGYGGLYGAIYEALQGAKDIKLFNRYEYILRRTNRSNRDIQESSLDSSLAYSIQAFALSFAPWIGYLLIVGVVVIGPINGKYSIGVLVSVLSLMWRLLVPIDKIAEVFAKYSEGKNALHRIGSISNMDNELSGSELIIDEKVCLEIKDLSFGYRRDNMILKNINMRISPGEKIAIIGESGSGKSTLVNILSYFYTDYSGDVLLNKKDLRMYSINSIRDIIAVVSQDVFLFNDSIRNNLLLGGEIDGDLSSVLNRIMLAEMVMKLEQREHTLVGDRGLMLSGGERQRVSIGRILQKLPSIVILDEATSALDEATERSIWKLVQEIFRGKTIICIAHRSSLLNDVDSVYKLENGEIRKIKGQM